MRCDTRTHTHDRDTDLRDAEKQSAIFHRVQGPREPTMKFGNDLYYLGADLFKDEGMLKYIFVRGLRNPKLRERVVEKYLTDQKTGNDQTLKELMNYAIMMEDVIKGTESISSGEHTANEYDSKSQFKKRQYGQNYNNPNNSSYNNPNNIPTNTQNQVNDII